MTPFVLPPSLLQIMQALLIIHLDLNKRPDSPPAPYPLLPRNSHWEINLQDEQ